MKMEVLSMQNHHLQQQFGVIGSTKVKKDWTSPLTPPTPAAVSTTSTPSSTTSTNNHHFPLHNPIEHFDVVDGIKPPEQNNSPQHYFATNNATLPELGPAHSIAMETGAATASPPKSGINTLGDAHYAYNNNLLYCVPNGPASTGATPIVSAETTSYHHNHHYPTTSSNAVSAYPPSPASSNLSTPTEATEHFGIVGHEYDVTEAAAVNKLSQRLQTELRAAKSRHLSCTEVSLPWDLTARIAADMIKTSEREPCGVRGCAIFIDFEDETCSARRIASFKVDPNTVSTFELFLTLKQDKGGWTSLLPQFLKNLTRCSTILISPHFTLHKHKLYACE